MRARQCCDVRSYEIRQLMLMKSEVLNTVMTCLRIPIPPGSNIIGNEVPIGNFIQRLAKARSK